MRRDSSFIKLGKEIIKMRIDKEIRREDLAIKANLSTSYLGAIERGERNISLNTLFKIVKALDETQVTLFLEG